MALIEFCAPLKCTRYQSKWPLRPLHRFRIVGAADQCRILGMKYDQILATDNRQQVSGHVRHHQHARTALGHAARRCCRVPGFIPGQHECQSQDPISNQSSASSTCRKPKGAWARPGGGRNPGARRVGGAPYEERRPKYGRPPDPLKGRRAQLWPVLGGRKLRKYTDAGCSSNPCPLATRSIQRTAAAITLFG